MTVTRYITNKPCPCGVGRTSGLATYLGGVPRGQNFAPDSAVYVDRMGNLVLRCRGGCGRERPASAVRGRYRPDIKCNARCTSSTGHVCDCSCGGLCLYTPTSDGVSMQPAFLPHKSTRTS